MTGSYRLKCVLISIFIADLSGMPKKTPNEFECRLNDSLSGNDFGYKESSDGQIVRGQIRTVTYTADALTGYQAKVAVNTSTSKVADSIQQGVNQGKESNFVQRIIDEQDTEKPLKFVACSSVMRNRFYECKALCTDHSCWLQEKRNFLFACRSGIIQTCIETTETTISPTTKSQNLILPFKKKKKTRNSCNKTTECSEKGGKCRKKTHKETNRRCKDGEIGKNKLCGEKCICCITKRKPSIPASVTPLSLDVCNMTSKCSKKGGKCRKKTRKEKNRGCKDGEIGKNKLCGKKCICCTTKRNRPNPPSVIPKPVCINKTECMENNGICMPNSDFCLTGLVNYVRCHSSYCKCCMAYPATETPVTTIQKGTRYPKCPKNSGNTTQTCTACGIANGPKASRVSGGVPVDIPNKFPWLVWIEYREKHWCGGSIVNNQFVLTAATCVWISCKRIPAQELTIVIADHNRNSKFDAQGITCKVKAKEVIHHPDFTACSTSPHTHDLALIKLSATLSFPAGSVLKPVCLPISSNAKYVENSAIVSGWGLTSPNSDYPDLPHEVNITVLNNIACNTEYWYYNGTYMLCAGATNQVKDSCIGDAGAPLIAEVIQGSYSVIGIVSGGHPQCIGPGVYTRVDKYLDWIKKTADQSKFC